MQKLIKRNREPHVKCKYIKLLEENLCDFEWEKIIGYDTKLMIYMEKVNKQDFIKIKNFRFMKDIGKRMKRQATDWGQFFVSLTKDLYQDIDTIFRI